MHVHKIQGSVAADALQRTQQSTSSTGPVDPVAAARGADAVQISDEGLALASQGTTTASTTSLDPQRADQIRSNILSGAYNSLEKADQVARAMIRSGDL